jgi:hypothetical protein
VSPMRERGTAMSQAYSGSRKKIGTVGMRYNVIGGGAKLTSIFHQVEGLRVGLVSAFAPSTSPRRWARQVMVSSSRPRSGNVLVITDVMCHYRLTRAVHLFDAEHFDLAPEHAES